MVLCSGLPPHRQVLCPLQLVSLGTWDPFSVMWFFICLRSCCFVSFWHYTCFLGTCTWASFFRNGVPQPAVPLVAQPLAVPLQLGGDADLCNSFSCLFWTLLDDCLRQSPVPSKDTIDESQMAHGEFLACMFSALWCFHLLLLFPLCCFAIWCLISLFVPC